MGPTPKRPVVRQLSPPHRDRARARGESGGWCAALRRVPHRAPCRIHFVQHLLEAVIRGKWDHLRMADARLPRGWTLQQIRDASGDQEAVVLDPDRSVKWVAFAGAREMPRPEIVLGFHSLCLVKPADGEGWYMGSLYDDGSIDCWTAFDDLYEALRGL